EGLRTRQEIHLRGIRLGEEKLRRHRAHGKRDVFRRRLTRAPPDLAKHPAARSVVDANGPVADPTRLPGPELTDFAAALPGQSPDRLAPSFVERHPGVM